jgi:hypothetical protein
VFRVLMPLVITERVITKNASPGLVPQDGTRTTLDEAMAAHADGMAAHADGTVRAH